MNTVKKRERPMRPSLFDWLEGDFPTLPVFHPFDAPRPMRVEEYVEDGQYVLRAELPGIDAGKDLAITVENGVLTVQAERREEKKEAQRSEFRYGAFTRSVSLPAGADEESVKATYADGILEIRIGMKAEDKQEAKRIQITKK